MKIESGSGFNLNISLIKDALQTGSTDAESTLVAATATMLDGHQGRGNLMEGSFVQTDSEPSRYIQATMIGLEVDNQFKTKLNAIVESYKLQAEATDSYAERSLVGRKAAEAVKDMVDGEVSEAEASRMDKEREEFEEKIEEKLEEKVSGEGDTADGMESGDESEAPAPSEASEAQADVSADTTAGPVESESGEEAVTAQEPVVSPLEGEVPQQSLDMTV